MVGRIPVHGVFFRCLYGLPILLVVAAGEWRSLGPMTRRSVGLSVVAGGCFAADLISFHYAVDLIGAGLATVMGNLQVVIVALAAWAVFGERPRGEVLAALPVMLAGVVLISGVVGSGAYGVDPRLGVSIGLVTAASYAGYLLVIRRASPDGRPAGPVAIATAVTAVGALVVGTIAGDLDLVPSMPAHAYLIALGVLSQSIGYLAIQVSLPRLPAVITSVLLLVQPVTTMLLAAILLRELPSAEQLLGVLLVIGGSRSPPAGCAGCGPPLRRGRGRGRRPPERRRRGGLGRRVQSGWSAVAAPHSCAWASAGSGGPSKGGRSARGVDTSWVTPGSPLSTTRNGTPAASRSSSRSPGIRSGARPRNASRCATGSRTGQPGSPC